MEHPMQYPLTDVERTYLIGAQQKIAAVLECRLVGGRRNDGPSSEEVAAHLRHAAELTTTVADWICR